MLSTRDNLILLIINKSHKAHLLSCAWRCSSKLQEIQSLENFISMAIQGTQVSMYIKHILFLYFSHFLIFSFMKNKINNTENKQQKHVKQCNETRLTQKKNKTLKLCKTKTRRERRSDRITWSPCSSTPWKSLSFEQTLEHEGFEKISKRSKRGLKLILASRCYHVVSLSSG